MTPLRTRTIVFMNGNYYPICKETDRVRPARDTFTVEKPGAPEESTAQTFSQRRMPQRRMPHELLP